MFLQMSVVGITGGISTGKSIAMTKQEGMTKSELGRQPGEFSPATRETALTRASP